MKRFSGSRITKAIPAQQTHWKSIVRLWRLIGLALLGLTLLMPASGAVLAGPNNVFPEVIPLPDGFNPEGIVIGRGTTFYVGSLATGAIYQGDLRTGQGSLLVQPQVGRISVGLSYDHRTNWIYVAGGLTGAGYIYDAENGANIAEFQFASSPTFVNDVVVTQSGAFFTDSSRPFLYKVPLEPNGRLSNAGGFQELPLSGDFNFLPGTFNANGIDATPDGKWLIIVQSSLGALYRVDPESGFAILIDLGGASVLNGDGILLHGKTMYVVQNFFNQISVVGLDPDLLSGEIEDVITSPLFRIPTTVDEFGNALYVVNARFNVPPGPDVEYEVVRVLKK